MDWALCFWIFVVRLMVSKGGIFCFTNIVSARLAGFIFGIF